MTNLISSQDVFFVKPQNIKVADKEYKDVFSHCQKEFIDNDGIKKTVNYLDGINSEHVAYVVDNKVTRMEEYYHNPQILKFGDKFYSNIISKTTIPDKHTTYSIKTRTGDYNQVRVRKNGAVLDINELYTKALIRKFKQPFIKLMQKIR